MASMADLPNEMLLMILSEHVPLADLAACARVCRRWRGLFRCKALRHYHNARFAYNLSTFQPSDAEVLSYVDLDFAGRRGNTPLHAAAAAGDTAGVEILLRRIEAEVRPEDRLRHYVDRLNNEGATPFLLAVSAENVPVAKRLADLGSDLEAAVRCSRHWRPIHFAVAHESVEFVKLLLSYGANVNAPDRFGATPLHVAAEASRSVGAAAIPDGSVEIARILMENGAVPLLMDFFAQTPLHVAALGRADVFEVLLDRSLSLLSRLKEPTARASQSGSGHPESVAAPDRCLPCVGWAHDHPLTWSDRGGYTALHRAAEAGNAGVLAAALGRAAERCPGNVRPVDVDARTLLGSTALHLAAARGDAQCVRVLVSAGADVNATGSAGRTPLDCAGRDTECARELHAAGPTKGGCARNA